MSVVARLNPLPLEVVWYVIPESRGIFNLQVFNNIRFLVLLEMTNRA